MTQSNTQLYYTGNPNNRDTDKWQTVPAVDRGKEDDPAKYYAPPDLAQAVNVALELGMPLLLTGEPGVGKSCLARSVAWELGFADGELLHYTVKSDTQSSDLFYLYDTLGRFHAAHAGATDTLPEKAGEKVPPSVDARRFITYQALGKAILYAKGRDNIGAHLMTDTAREKYPPERRRAVVLIDEIDKAPGHMPNDILNQIERMEFEVPELFSGEKIKLEKNDQPFRPVVIITSNSTRELPDAFLRRCLYYHVGLPPFQEALHKTAPEDAAITLNEITVEYIVAQRLGEFFEGRQPLLDEALSLFRFLRGEKGPKRKPSLAELLNWLHYLGLRRTAVDRLEDHPDFKTSVTTTLLKRQGEQENWPHYLAAWKSQKG